MRVLYFTVLTGRIKIYYVVISRKFHPEFKFYLKLPPLHNTSYINSWLKYYVNNCMVYGLAAHVTDNLNAPIARDRFPASIWNRLVRLQVPPGSIFKTFRVNEQNHLPGRASPTKMCGTSWLHLLAWTVLVDTSMSKLASVNAAHLNPL